MLGDTHEARRTLVAGSPRLIVSAAEGPAAAASRKQIVTDVASLRKDGEIKSYIDLLFLALAVVLCIAKIVTN